MLTEERYNSLLEFCNVMRDKFVSTSLLEEILDEYKSLQRTERDAEFEKMLWAERAAHYQEMLRTVVAQIEQDRFKLDMAHAVAIIADLWEAEEEMYGVSEKLLAEAEKFVDEHETWYNLGMELREAGKFYGSEDSTPL